MPLAILWAVMLAPIWIPLLPFYLPVWLVDTILYNLNIDFSLEPYFFEPLSWLFGLF